MLGQHRYYIPEHLDLTDCFKILLRFQKGLKNEWKYSINLKIDGLVQKRHTSTATF